MTRLAPFLLLLASCQTVLPAAGAAGGAAAGPLFGPGGAALGAAAGSIATDVRLPPEEVVLPPDDIWSLLGQFVDKAFWLVILLGAGYLLFWFLPAPFKLNGKRPRS